MVIKSALKVRAASESGLGQLQGTVQSQQDDGTVVVLMEGRAADPAVGRDTNSSSLDEKRFGWARRFRDAG